jgi:polysaccharide pyruvyl transferase CsaB
MKVVISGYYGFSNIGDEAVLKAIIQGLRKHDPGTIITVLSATPHLTRNVYNIDSIYRYDWGGIIRKLTEADLFISGGGTLLQNITSRLSLFYYLVLIFLAKLLGKKVMILAQGFGPIRGAFSKLAAKAILNITDLITLRDNDSLVQIRKIGMRRHDLYITADPVWMLRSATSSSEEKFPNLLRAKREGKLIIGISLRSAPKRGKHPLFERFCQTLAKGLNQLHKEHPLYPVFLLFQCAEDMPVTSKVVSLISMNSEVVSRACTPDEMMNLIAHCDLLIGMRLHSLIFAAIDGLPMLGLSYDPKVEAFMKSIGQPYLTTETDIDPKIISEHIKKSLNSRDKIHAELVKLRDYWTMEAENNFVLLESLLGKGGLRR